MLRVLKEDEAHILNNLSNKYLLNNEDQTKESIEVETITELAVVFWHYAPSAEGVKITMPWFEFALSMLAPVMFKPQQFKFNAVMGKCVLKPIDHRENLLVHFKEYDEWMVDKAERKAKDAEDKKKKPQVVPEV